MMTTIAAAAAAAAAYVRTLYKTPVGKFS